MINFHPKYVTKCTYNNLINGEPQLLYEETTFKITPEGITVEGKGFTKKRNKIIKFTNRGFATFPPNDEELKKGSILEIVWTDKPDSEGSEKDVLHKTLVEIKDVDPNGFVTKIRKIEDFAQDLSGTITKYNNNKLAFGNWVSCTLLNGITTNYNQYL